MKCSDTGEHVAIELSDVDIPLVQDVNEAIRGVRQFGHGNGQVILNLVNGLVQTIDFTCRKHRTSRKATK
jgi:hypothetical protein